ncbi:MAG TPA: YihY/virulence factor BrkB family protein [Terriglobia bacterium]|nr:YihY/virulence factor BrkB family protein [Terriglobia bacterium]
MPFRVLKSALWKFFEDDGPFMARGLAFGLLIYCIPLALMTVTALSYLLASSSGALTWVRQLTGALIPQFEKQFNNYLNTVVQNRGLLGLASFLAFLFASSTTFGSMRLVLNTVFGAKESRGIVHGKIMEMVMMVLTSAVVFVIMSVVYLLTLVESLAAALPLWKTGIRAIEQVFPRFHAFVHPLSLVLASVVTFTATVVMFWFLYRFTPARRPGNEALFIGATVAAALFEISKFAFAWYVASAHRTTALYGTLSGLAFFLVWMYYASAVFVFGAEISSALDQQRKRKKR